MLQLVQGLGVDDTVPCLISDGGSALLPLPLDGHGFFDALQDTIISGSTLTNVDDFRAVLMTSN